MLEKNRENKGDNVYSDDLIEKAKEVEIGNNNINFIFEEKEAIEDFIKECIRWRKFELLKRIKNKNFLLDITINLIEKKDKEFSFTILTESKEVKRVFEKEQVDKIVEAFSKNIEFVKSLLINLNIGAVVEIYKEYNLNKDEIKDVVDELLESQIPPSFGKFFYVDAFLFDLCMLVENNVFLDLVREKVNNKLVMENILQHLIGTWNIIERMRKVEKAYEEIGLLKCLYKLKGFLTNENYEKIMNFFMSRNVEKLIKRRIKKKEHHEYIRYVLEFLPKPIRDKYANHIIVSYI